MSTEILIIETLKSLTRLNQQTLEQLMGYLPTVICLVRPG